MSDMHVMIFLQTQHPLTINYKVVAILYLFFIAEIILHVADTQLQPVV